MSGRDGAVAARDAVLGFGYRRLVKPLAFRLDEETVHDRVSSLGTALGRSGLTRGLTRAMFGYEHPALAVEVAGIRFRNPLGLSAGFDKEGRLLDILPSVGFGFVEIGSITGSPSSGNPKPRLWRLPKSRALVVNYGLNSSGSAVAAQCLRGKRFGVPVAISIAKANHPDFDTIEAGIADYVLAARNMRGLGAVRVVNISCPNTTGGEPFLDASHLDNLLTALDPLPADQPVFIKLPADATNAELDGIIKISVKHQVTGFICTNLSKRRDAPGIVDTNVPQQGGISGKVVEARSNEVLAYVYRQTEGRMPLIGVGGVFTADDAYRKIRLGASLVSLITGMVYRGPSVLSEIKRGLVRLLQRDGFTSVGEAVGVDSRHS